MTSLSIGEKIKSLRKEKKLTQTELAKKANISRSYLGDLERNRYNPSIETLNSIADALDSPRSLLIDERENIEDCMKALMRGYCYPSELEQRIIYDSTPEGDNTFLAMYDDYRNIPLVGTVRAGEPILASDNVERYIPVCKMFLDGDRQYFFLRVKGDSMDKEFPEGTLLLIEKMPCVENGTIAVVLIDGNEATVKKVVIKENMITLIPCSNNSEYIPKMYDIKKDQIRIIGRVKQAIKEY